MRPFTSDTLPLNLAAREGEVRGVAGDVRWQLGVDPERGVAPGLSRGELGAGDLCYQRALATLAVSHPLALGTAFAVEAGAGAGWGDLPPQKDFFLGGPATLRGYPGSYLGGESFWMRRAELGLGIPAAHQTAFTDVGWAGPRRRWTRARGLWSVGGGLSFLDGLLRMDLAWPMRESSGVRFYLYTGALF